MPWRARLASLTLLGVLGCGQLESDRGGPPADVEIGGSYQVTGVTTDKESGAQRAISGIITLAREGDSYTSHFELDTLFPGSDATAAKAVGTGEGQIDGMALDGTADIQLVIASVPNVDVGFAFVPRGVGPKIRSSVKAQFFEDGTVRMEVENQPAEGADYRPTHTTLVGFPRTSP